MYYQGGQWKVSTNIFSSAAIVFASDHAQTPDSISRKLYTIYGFSFTASVLDVWSLNMSATKNVSTSMHTDCHTNSPSNTPTSTPSIAPTGPPTLYPTNSVSPTAAPTLTPTSGPTLPTCPRMYPYLECL